MDTILGDFDVQQFWAPSDDAEQEFDYKITLVADNFESFIRGLEGEQLEQTPRFHPHLTPTNSLKRKSFKD
jgi:hypothetical protein